MEAIDKLLGIIKFVGPLVTVFFSILIAYGMVKSAKRMGKATKELSEDPITIFFAIIVIAFFLWLYFAKIAPILDF